MRSTADFLTAHRLSPTERPVSAYTSPQRTLKTVFFLPQVFVCFFRRKLLSKTPFRRLTFYTTSDFDPSHKKPHHDTADDSCSESKVALSTQVKSGFYRRRHTLEFSFAFFKGTAERVFQVLEGTTSLRTCISSSKFLPPAVPETAASEQQNEAPGAHYTTESVLLTHNLKAFTLNGVAAALDVKEALSTSIFGYWAKPSHTRMCPGRFLTA